MTDTSKDLRFGVIGCGSIATEVHCPNLVAIPGSKIVAYCDVELDKAQKLLQTHGGEYATVDADDVLDDKSIDAVLIQTGPKWHPVLVQKAARAGKHIFVEKPIALELDDALETVGVVEQSGVKFIFGTCNRLAPMVQRAKQMCPQPRYSSCHSFGSVAAQAPHMLDLAVNLFHDSPLSRVYASGGQYWNRDPDLPADSFAAVLTFADGSTHALIQHGSFNVLLLKYHYQLFGQNCCVYLARRFKECHLMKGSDLLQSWVFNGQDSDRGPHGYMGHYEELKELVDCIRHGGNGTMTVRD